MAADRRPSLDFVVEVPAPAVEFNEVYRNFVGSAGYFVANNVYSRLVVYDTGSPAAFPDLAEHWEMAQDARTLRFQLNRNARWHDGHPVTAHDVAHTHLTALANGYHAASFLQDVQDIEVLDDHTLRYALRRPNAGFLAQLGNLVFAHVLPRHLYEGTDWADNPHNQHPVGSGPFRFAEHVPGERIVLEAWKDYWGPPAGVDRVVLDIEPDLDEAVRKVADGRAHYMVQDVLTFPRLHLAEHSTTASLWRKRGPGVAVLGFNHTRERWRDRRARAGVAHAVDRRDLEPLADPGWSEPYAHYLPRSVEWAYADDATAPAFDPELAGRLLGECGVTGTAPLRLVYMKTFTGHAGIAAVVAENLRAAGVDVEVAGLDSPAWSREVAGEADFDLSISGGNMIPDPEITSSRFETGGGRNHTRLSDPEADACYAAARASVDRVRRGEHYRELQRVWARNVDWVPLFWYAAYYLRSDDFFGWPDQIGFRVPFWHWGRIRPATP
ncbi:ABC transporter substrate-binding protein [Streptosporangium sp. NPDC020145]|uniref:ABC transporter substrate-binding protein n=1 Tax=Streptosporangium sp. NPDC020145 TaxID=3154694 RepID=UPI00341F5E07